MPLQIEAQPLEGWMIATEAADELGVSKQQVHKMMVAKEFKSLRRVGSKPIYLVKISEVGRVKVKRNLEAQRRLERRQEKEDEAQLRLEAREARAREKEKAK